MIESSRQRPRRDMHHDGEENPFWISLADMMTGLACLFIVIGCSVMLMWIAGSSGTSSDRSVAVGSLDPEQADSFKTNVTNEALPPSGENDKGTSSRLVAYGSSVSAALRAISLLSRQYGFQVNPVARTIDLGSAARFPLASDRLSTEQESLLSSYVDSLVDLAQNDPALVLLKSITVVGYTDPAGSYLFNLDLSARRSERLMCALLDPSTRERDVYAQRINSSDEKRTQMIRTLFKLGGYSAAEQKSTPEASRRLSLKLDFYGLDEPRQLARSTSSPIGKCPLNER
ncbi:outer membrane protein OmpA-like peptidoglycan-associated protein [Robbsia andropogonis]|uniref:hypothetical protein n=1 Tax=Robbsia andropogonis TaxID=28092 RepID=UPI0020A1F2C2|nr:hypothetical protein [Robbsia andropogonis]MCP1117383.1 hypothetical protein [Robbsia andropogonis]MCP1126849.1 hypothetical protein [Robbsia andropogonis]